MKILGFINGSHDCGVSLIEDGEIKGCFTEERFSRVKSAHDPLLQPIRSIEAIQKYFKFNILDDDVVLTTSTPIHSGSEFFKYILSLNKDIHVYPHHDCHAFGAYATSGFKNDKVLNVVIDGSESNNVEYPCVINIKNVNDIVAGYKNSRYATIYSSYNGSTKKLEEYFGTPHSNFGQYYTQCHNIIPSLWSVLLPALGLTNLKDEGKIMGLAAQGKFDQVIYDLLEPCFSYKDLKFDLYKTNCFRFIIQYMSTKYDFNDKTFRSNLCYNFQKLTEDTIVKFIADLHKKYPDHNKLCLSGGLFANVKLNQKINELLSFDEVYIMPAMSDEGIAFGSCVIHSSLKDKPLEIKRWDNVFLGIGYTQSELDSYINIYRHNIESYDVKRVANLLVEGKVVGTFQNRSEFGPRALGARSILVEPTRKETHEYINKKLDRNEVMPFAPIVMSEHISDICYAYKSLRSAEFMTLCYTVREEWASKIPAVINTYDNTARPQVIYKERNVFFHDILSEFYNLTGIPVLMNTSFNSHGEPILNHPTHAITHLNKGSVDYLILGDKLLSLKK